MAAPPDAAAPAWPPVSREVGRSTSEGVALIAPLV